MLSVIDIPQHLVAAAVASTFFSGPIALVVFVGLPLTFKAVSLCTTQGSTLNKMAKAGDHFMRLAAKVTIISASFASMYAVPFLSVAQTWAFVRTFILIGSFVKDASLTSMYGMSGMDSFENAIAPGNR